MSKKASNERNERSGEFKGVKERDEVFVSRGGFWQDQGSEVTILDVVTVR